MYVFIVNVYNKIKETHFGGHIVTDSLCNLKNAPYLWSHISEIPP